MTALLTIENLHVEVGGKEILSGLSLEVPKGQVHAIMGPNGSGKSTLAFTLAGREGYDVTQGAVSLAGMNLLTMPPEARAAAGFFLAFQYPVEIPGVSTSNFLRASLNSVRKARGQDDLDAIEFLRHLKKRAQKLGMADDMLKRPLNAGFSGGEKKRNEVLQMAVLEPQFAVLDETDSGLDIDALKVVAEGVNALRGPERSMLVITHYQRLLDYIRPDVVHVLAGGRIQRTGGPELALELERTGYAPVAGGGA